MQNVGSNMVDRKAQNLLILIKNGTRGAFEVAHVESQLKIWEIKKFKISSV